MIVIDTSALMAIALREPDAGRCLKALKAPQRLLISAVTVAEAMIVSDRRGFGEAMQALIEGYGFEMVPANSATARRVAAAYARWGKGVHPAALNFVDCFAYELAVSEGCALLYLGDDFRRTDVQSVL